MAKTNYVPKLAQDPMTVDNTVTAEAMNSLGDEVNHSLHPLMTGTVATAAATAAKVVTLDAPDAARAPQNGDWFLIKFTLGSAVSSPTLAINGAAALPIMTPQGSGSSSNISIAANVTVLMYNDNGTLRLMSSQSSALASVSAAEIDTGTSTSSRVVTPQILAQKFLTNTTVPASATATGRVGQFAYDSSFLYICTATNTWRRVAIAAW